MAEVTVEQALNIAFEHHNAGRLADAEQIYQQILAFDANQWQAYYLLSKIAVQREQFEAALELTSKSIAINPSHADAHYGAGEACRQLQRFDEAIKWYQGAIRLDPNRFPPCLALAELLLTLGRLDEATQVGRYIAPRFPEIPEAMALLGDISCAHKNWREAVEAYSRALKLNPRALGATYNLGNAYFFLQRFEEAKEAFLRAVELNPNHANTHHNLCATYYMLRDYANCLASADRALAINPALPESRMNRENGLASFNRLDEAIAEFRESIRLRPDYPEARWNLATALLKKGQLREGWELFEARLNIPEHGLKRDFPQPHWDGSPLPGKTVLLHTEGGFGDAIQFIRLVPILAADPKYSQMRFMLECQATLTSLFQQVQGISGIFGRGESLPSFDAQIPLQSLMRIMDIQLQTIPGEVPYLKAPEDRKQFWANRLNETTGLKVGLVWAGNVYDAHKEYRTRSADVFKPLAAVPNVQFFSLQKGQGAETRPPVELKIIDWTSELNDWSETAAIVDQLDLIITVDTSMAHLAGALAKPVWVLIPEISDFRWLLDRDDSPWYPTMRLFRQKKAGSWTEEIEKMRDDLRELSKKSG